jgi:NDP-sugar pyrophosphorylase family protein
LPVKVITMGKNITATMGKSMSGKVVIMGKSMSGKVIITRESTIGRVVTTRESTIGKGATTKESTIGKVVIMRESTIGKVVITEKIKKLFIKRLPGGWKQLLSWTSFLKRKLRRSGVI